MDTNKLALNIANPAKKAGLNCEQSDNYVSQCYHPTFLRLDKNKGMGRFLYTMVNHPGLTKKELFKTIFGDKGHAQYSETFQMMKWAELFEIKIIERKYTYWITPLGIALLKQNGIEI